MFVFHVGELKEILPNEVNIETYQLESVYIFPLEIFYILYVIDAKGNKIHCRRDLSWNVWETHDKCIPHLTNSFLKVLISMKLLIGIYQYYINISLILFSNISEKNAKHIVMW